MSRSCTLSVLPVRQLTSCFALILALFGFAATSARAQQVVISQVYGAGGLTSATYNRDYVELHNRSVSSVNITNWSIQYASATGLSWSARTLTGTIPAGGYFLVQVTISIVAFLKSRPHPSATSRNAQGMSATNHATSAITTVQPAMPARFQVLHSFGPRNEEGVNGWGVVTLSSDGYLYGCTVNLGRGGGGSIYRVRTNGSDYAVLHSFNRTNDGAEPTGGVIEGRDGNLYGTTFRGGRHDSGVVFRMARDGRDYRVLHHFAATNDCRNPQSELLEGKDGWIYGTATGGGGNALGGVFKIAKDGTGYAIVTGFFRGLPDDPRRPVGGLMQTSDGAFYGTTKMGGVKNNGTIFRLDAGGTLTVLKSLGLMADGIMNPEGTLMLASEIDRQDRIAAALSHGERRQLEIAMILATQPELLLFDEPLAGMGYRESQDVIALLRRIAQSHTLVLIEHDMDAVFSIADRVTVLVNGTVLETGPVAAIQSSPAVQAAYLGTEEQP